MVGNGIKGEKHQVVFRWAECAEPVLHAPPNVSVQPERQVDEEETKEMEETEERRCGHMILKVFSKTFVVNVSLK